MRKIMLLAVMAVVSVITFAQNTERSLVVQQVDSMNEQRIINLENQLTSFSRQNSSSITFMLVGSALLATGLIFPETNVKEFPVMTILGTGSFLLGTGLYIDSFRFLNINKKKKAKTTAYQNAL